MACRNVESKIYWGRRKMPGKFNKKNGDIFFFAWQMMKTKKLSKTIRQMLKMFFECQQTIGEWKISLCHGCDFLN